MDIRPENLWSSSKYKKALALYGFELVAFRSLQPYVLDKWLPRALTRYLDYVHVRVLKSTLCGFICGKCGKCAGALTLENIYTFVCARACVYYI